MGGTNKVVFTYKKPKSLLFICFIILCAYLHASADNASDSMICDARDYFHKTTDFSYSFIDDYFSIRAAWSDDQENWRVIFTYHDIYDDRFSTACRGHVYNGEDGRVIEPLEFIVVFDSDCNLCDNENSGIFPILLERYMTEANHWYRIEKIKKQKGYNEKYGRIWQFWPPEIKADFYKEYGHPSGFWTGPEILSPKESVLPYEAMLRLVQDFIIDNNLSIDLNKYCIDSMLTMLPCSEINDNDQTWLIRLYSQDVCCKG